MGLSHGLDVSKKRKVSCMNRGGPARRVVTVSTTDTCIQGASYLA